MSRLSSELRGWLGDRSQSNGRDEEAAAAAPPPESGGAGGGVAGQEVGAPTPLGAAQLGLRVPSQKPSSAVPDVLISSTTSSPIHGTPLWHILHGPPASASFSASHAFPAEAPAATGQLGGLGRQAPPPGHGEGAQLVGAGSVGSRGAGAAGDEEDQLAELLHEHLPSISTAGGLHEPLLQPSPTAAARPGSKEQPWAWQLPAAAVPPPPQQALSPLGSSASAGWPPAIGPQPATPHYYAPSVASVREGRSTASELSRAAVFGLINTIAGVPTLIAFAAIVFRVCAATAGGRSWRGDACWCDGVCTLLGPENANAMPCHPAAASMACLPHVRGDPRPPLGLLLLWCVSEATSPPTLQHPLYAPWLPQLCKFFYLASAIHQLVAIGRSSLPHVVAQVMRRVGGLVGLVGRGGSWCWGYHLRGSCWVILRWEAIPSSRWDCSCDLELGLYCELPLGLLLRPAVKAPHLNGCWLHPY